jgi:hypothetical protein
MLKYQNIKMLLYKYIALDVVVLRTKFFLFFPAFVRSFALQCFEPSSTLNCET